MPSLGLRGRVRSYRTDSRFPSLSSQDRSPLPSLKFPLRCTLRARLTLGPRGTRPPRGGSRLSPRSWTYPACPPPSGFRGTVHHTPGILASGAGEQEEKKDAPEGKFWAKESIAPTPTSAPTGRFSFPPAPPSYSLLECSWDVRFRAFDGKVETRKLRSPAANLIPALASRARGTEYPDPSSPVAPPR